MAMFAGWTMLKSFFRSMALLDYSPKVVLQNIYIDLPYNYSTYIYIYSQVVAPHYVARYPKPPQVVPTQNPIAPAGNPEDFFPSSTKDDQTEGLTISTRGQEKRDLIGYLRGG